MEMDVKELVQPEITSLNLQFDITTTSNHNLATTVHEESRLLGRDTVWLLLPQFVVIANVLSSPIPSLC
jgi:hypothetical protein